MSAPQFTPGPWNVAPINDRYGIDDIIPVEAASGFEVCEAYGWKTSRHPAMTLAEGEANARLIATAPDMFDALLQYRDDLRHPPEGDSFDRRLERVEKLIAQVVGQQVTA